MLLVQSLLRIERLFRRIVWHVCFMQPNVHKEGAVFVLADEFYGFVGQLCRSRMRRWSVVNSRFVEAVDARMGRVGNGFTRQMPLAEMTGSIASLLQHSRNHRGLRIEPIGHTTLVIQLVFREMLIDSVASGEMSRHGGRAA